MADYCCNDFKKAAGYEASNLNRAGKKTWLINVGRNKISAKAAERLAELTLNPKQLKGMPKHRPNEIIAVPVLLPIRFCPFCGSKFGD